MQRSYVYKRCSFIINQRNHEAVIEDVASEVIFEFVLERGSESFITIGVRDIKIDPMVHETV
jgi:hypothetical protein